MNHAVAEYMAALADEIETDERFAGEVAALAGALRRDNLESLANSFLVTSQQFRIKALELRGKQAAAARLGLLRG